jgi:5-methylcytosine-specific restriction endonuclease McrA
MGISSSAEAEKILKEELHWPEIHILVGKRAKFKCEYCGKYLLASYEDYDQWQIDHIVPDGNNDPENLALSCKLCNFVKRHTSPTTLTTKTDRESLINAARQIVAERRKIKEEIFSRTLEVILVLKK